jgi:hypothetical protein
VKRLAVLLALASLPTAVARADGCPPVTCGTTSVAEPGSGVLLVRPNGDRGPLVVHDALTGAERTRLPAGLLAADGRSFVTWRSARARTTIRLHAVGRRTRPLRSWTFRLQAWPAIVSADARTIVLQARSPRHTSRFLLLDTRRGRITDRIFLRGSYELEAVSPEARRLFLIRWGDASYDLRTYDVVTRTIRPTLLAEPDEKMSGYPVRGIATPDGGWLLTLYAKTNGTGFVHALDLRTGIAHCIDLPWRSRSAFGVAVPALSPDGRRLYLANPALGRLTAVDLRDLHGGRTTAFARASVAGLGATAPNAAVTANGRMLAFSGGRNVWLYDTAYGIVRGPFAAAERVRVRTGIQPEVGGLGFDAAGRRLLALTTDRARASFDAASGRRLDGKRTTELFAVRSGGAFGQLLGYSSTGGPRFALPEGHASADGTSYFTALPRRGRRTAIERWSPATGALISSRVIAGRWTLGAVSPSAKTIAIGRHANRTTWLRVFDAATARPLSARTLRGVYTIEAVSDDGQRLFLIQHYRGGNYAVRALDLVRDRLWTATLREKGETESPVMKGTSAGQVASPDGRWLLTLYLDTRKRAAFVHALNLRRAYAACIDLPSRAPLRQLRDYSLALGRDGAVYASNGTLGVLARVDLRRESVAETLRFPARGVGGGWAASGLSRDGRALYFASGSRVWRYDVASRSVRGPVKAPGPVLGFSFSRDGRKVYAARADRGVVVFDASGSGMVTA